MIEPWKGRLAGTLALLSLAISLVAALVFDRQYKGTSLLTLSNLVGPTVASVLQGHGLTACTVLLGTSGNPICFHGGWMPLPTLVVASGVWLMGDHFVSVGLLKTALLLLPVEGAIFLACLRLAPEGTWRRWITGVLLLAPFGISAFLADVVNLQVEEGYSYSFLALVTAIVLFGRRGARRTVPEAIVFGASIAGLYLSKSAMAPAAAVLTMAYVARAGRPAVRAIAAVVALSAPVGWAMYQHHATGRYSLGTTIDGFNLRKGNDEIALARYPPPPGRYAGSIRRGVERWTPVSR